MKKTRTRKFAETVAAVGPSAPSPSLLKAKIIDGPLVFKGFYVFDIIGFFLFPFPHFWPIFEARKEKRGTFQGMPNVPTQVMCEYTAKTGGQTCPRTPRSSTNMNKKNYRKFAFRTNAAEIAEWNRAAKKQQQPLAVFLRQAAHAHKAGMSTAELNSHLIEMRRLLNAALMVRTPDMKNLRVTQVRDHLTKMLHRANNIRRNPFED